MYLSRYLNNIKFYIFNALPCFCFAVSHKISHALFIKIYIYYLATRSKVGALTLHASACCDGVGLFFLVRKCSILSIRGEHAAILPTPYLDQWGEEDVGFKRGRPLFLDHKRWDKLVNDYKFHRISHSVAAVRSSTDTVIRSNYY